LRTRLPRTAFSVTQERLLQKPPGSLQAGFWISPQADPHCAAGTVIESDAINALLEFEISIDQDDQACLLVTTRTLYTVLCTRPGNVAQNEVMENGY
jgi:hypothetical protein